MARGRLLKALEVVIAVTFAAILIISLPSAGAATLLRALLVLCALALVCFGASFASERVLDIALAVLLCGFGVLVYTFAYQLKLEPAWDFGRVYFGAKEIIINNSMAYTSNYFLESYNNFFTAVYIARFVQLCANFGTISVIDGGILLNVISITLSAVFISLAARTALGSRAGLLTGLLCVTSAPLWSYSAIFYTDTLALPYVSALMWIIAAALKKDLSLRASLLLGAAAGACAFVGYRVKAYAAFPLIAAAVVILLSGKFKQKLKFLAAAACVCAVCFSAYNIWVRNTDMLDYKNIEKYRLPAAHYVYMGLVGNGGYSGAAHQEMDELPDADARTARSLEKISKQLEDYGVGGLLEHLAVKINYTWSDGLMYSDKKLAASDKLNTTAKYLAMPDGLYHSEYRACAQSFHYAMLIALVAGAVWAALRKERESETVTVARVAIWGLALLLLVWETRSRYLVSFIPLYAMCEAAFICRVTPDKSLLKRYKREAT